MGTYLKKLDLTPKARKLARHSNKGYWTETLTKLWKSCHESEKCFVKMPRNVPGYRAVRDRFLTNQRKFDKELKKSR